MLKIPKLSNSWQIPEHTRPQFTSFCISLFLLLCKILLIFNIESTLGVQKRLLIGQRV